MWCWGCDGLADHQPGDKAKLKEMLESEPLYKQRWNEEWIPKDTQVFLGDLPRDQQEVESFLHPRQ